MKNKQVEKISEELTEASRDQAILDGLSEIYHDDQGKLIDVKTLDIRKKRGWLFWLISGAVGCLLLGLAYLGLNQVLKHGVNTDAVDFAITTDHQPVAGEEFFLLVDYQNNNQLEINDAQIHLTYPNELIYLDSLPKADENNNTWSVGSLPAGAHGQIKVKVRMIAELAKNSLVLGDLRYKLQGFSTEYKKSTEASLSLSDLGLDISIISPDSVLVGEKQKIVVKYQARKPYLDNFRLVIEPSDANNLEFIADVQKNTNVTLVKPWVFQVNNITDQEQELVIYYKVIDKINPRQGFDFKFSYLLNSSAAESLTPSSTTSSDPSIEIGHPAETFYFFREDTLDLEVVKNSLNLLLLINGSDKDQSVDFGQTLNYSLSYENKGETPLTDLSFTAVINGDLVDWSSLKDKNHGLVKDNTITWSGEQIKELASLAKGASGAIDFSIKMKEAGSGAKNDQLKSYAQFQVGASDDLAALVKLIKDRETNSTKTSDNKSDNKPVESALATVTENNKSNTIINSINSDFQVAQSILYFNDDNIPVGAGPLPMEVDKDTSLRVYWKIKNSFHDLNTVRVAVKIPDYGFWQDKTSQSAGSMRYDAATHQVIWELQNLPKTMGEATAEFSLNFRPNASQRNKIIVLLPAAEATAHDALTGGNIRRLSAVKTSKLEDDKIVKSVNLDAASGLVK